MKTYISRFLIIAALFMFTGCGGAVNTKYHLVKNHKPRKSTLGFSVLPPPGKNWYEKLKNDSLLYLKISDSSDSYSIFTEAREVRLKKNVRQSKDLLRYVKREKNKLVANKAYRNSKSSYQIEKSLSKHCVRYQQSYEDHGMKGLRGRRHVEVNTGGLFCAHPGNPKVAVDVSYVEKTLSNVVAKSYRNEGETFLASLNFLQVRR